MKIEDFKKSLVNFPRPVKNGMVIIGDIFLCVFTVWISIGLLLNQWGLLDGSQWWVLVASVSFSLPIFIFFGLYRAIFRYIGAIAFASIAKAFIVYFGLYFSAFTIFGIEHVPRAIGVIQPALLFIAIGLSRYLMRYCLGSVNTYQSLLRKSQTTALIYGAGAAGRQLAAGLNIDVAIAVKGFIDDDPKLHGRSVNGLPIYAGYNLRSLIIKLQITDVLLAIPSVSQLRRNQIISNLNDCGVRVRTLPGVLDIASGRVKVTDLHDLDMNDLLGRKVVPPDVGLLEKNIRNQVVLVTGAGGSIGSELCRQIIKFVPSALILLDNNEYSLYKIIDELRGGNDQGSNSAAEGCYQSPADDAQAAVKIFACLASVRDEKLMRKIISDYKPFIVFHAAAYKHVSLVEENIAEGVSNNVFGTLNCARASIEGGVSNFILVSTDKAVRPTSVMGASKRVAELVLQALSNNNSSDRPGIRFSMVRFGNVLGSSGSVAPIFSSQIKSGGPITLTNREVTRYFMTIPEAAQLVIQSSSMATGGDVFVLDMGAPVRIYDLAVKMIYLSGLMVKDEMQPHGDIEIKIIGLRPGEKLYEELLIGNSPEPTRHPKIMKAHEEYFLWSQLCLDLEKLKIATESGDVSVIIDILKKLVPECQFNRVSAF